jgi:hypothetical protein
MPGRNAYNLAGWLSRFWRFVAIGALTTWLIGCATPASSGSVAHLPAKGGGSRHNISPKVLLASSTQSPSPSPQKTNQPPSSKPPIRPPASIPSKLPPSLPPPPAIRVVPVGATATVVSGLSGPLMGILSLLMLMESDNPSPRLQMEGHPTPSNSERSPPSREKLEFPGMSSQVESKNAPGSDEQTAQAPGPLHGPVQFPGADDRGPVLVPGADDKSERKEAGSTLKSQVDILRRGGTVRVKTIEEARAILKQMPELVPATEDRKMPNPDGTMKDGFADPNGTYRGDLINKNDPAAPVHPGVANPEHRDFPHYNIKLPNGKKAAIIIKGE